MSQRNLEDVLSGRSLAELCRLVRKSREQQGTFVDATSSVFGQLDVVIEELHAPKLMAIREEERSASADSLKLRIR